MYKGLLALTCLILLLAYRYRTDPMSKATLIPRRSLARGNADHGWLKSFHTFSFASYYDPKFQAFGPLRVINEDRVEPATGFGAHSHKEFEIFSYIVNGELQHNDSMHNQEKLRRGELQMTSAGTGITHSEYNTNKQEQVHFLQIWVKPYKSGLKPAYTTKKFSDELKKDKLALIVKDIASPKAADVVPINAALSMYASILSPGISMAHTMESNSAYVHLIMTSGYTTPSNAAKIRVNDQELSEGDGLFVNGKTELNIESLGAVPAEFLLFDIEQ